MNRSFFSGLVRTLCMVLLLSACSDGSKEEKAGTEDKGAVSKPEGTLPQEETVREEAAENVAALPAANTEEIRFEEVRINHPNGDTFTLSVPAGFTVKPVAWGMKRIRFMDISPDGRLFLSDMYSLEDNRKGKIYILSGFDDSVKVFRRTSVYLDNLRNPNNLAFYKDPSGQQWLYVTLTDKLIRYRYEENDEQPSQEPEVLDTYPDYGLSYRYGGWHLTRTIEFGDNGKMYISVGSSCNSCVEKEEVRASVIEMDPDGKNRKIMARGVRNAVGLEWAEGNLYATNMAADHLGKDKPDDVMLRILSGKHYGWPYCYHWRGKVYNDPKYDTAAARIDAKTVPGAFSYLGAHTAPLGLAWFGKERAGDPALQNYFLVAQHGSYSPSIGKGYSLQRVRENEAPEDFITGFLDKNNKIHGRPCGIYPLGEDRFYFTDDKFGTLYLVYKK